MIDLSQYEQKVLSQHGEDGITLQLFKLLGTTNRYYLELGASATEGCTNIFWNKNWKGLVIDAQHITNVPSVSIVITKENINGVLQSQQVPHQPDFCSIDLDYNTYWIWEALEYRPRVLCIEYNGFFAPEVEAIVRYNPNKSWDGGSYFGASLLSLHKLARRRNYSLVYCENSGTNAYFVLDECIKDLQFVNINNIQLLWKPLCWANDNIWCVH